VPKQEIATLPEDQYYQFDLIGCKVFDGEKEIGNVINVEQYPANDVIFIESSDGTLYSLAALDTFVTKIDIANKRIEINAAGLVSNKL
jgi:16S rRNA processing protein RimM